MNYILQLHNLKTRLSVHEKVASSCVNQKLFHAAKLECEECIKIEKQIEMVINQESMK